MKILKINPYINSTSFKSKPVLTKALKTSKIDMFCKSNEVKEALNKNFVKLRDEFSKNWYKLYLKSSCCDWNFYINSTEENLKKMTLAQDEFSNLFHNREAYEEFKKIDSSKLSKHEQKQLKNILKNFEEELETGDDLKLLREKENLIAKKYNSFVPRIDGKETTKTEISKILQTEPDEELRKKAYLAKLEGGDLIAEDIREFVKLRNIFARKKGYSNFFEYKLKENYEVELPYLEKLIDEVYSNTKDSIKSILEKKHQELKDFFKTDKLKQYHYGYLTDSNPDKYLNESIKTREQAVDICLNTYKSMGYDIDKLLEEKNLTLDLFPRKGKNTHGFCFNIDAGKDARILANLTNDINSIDTLNHELGHCVYTLGVSRELPFIDREEYPAMTEAIAMMMGDIVKKENILKNLAEPKVFEDFKNTFKENEASFVTKALTIIDFEKEMYKNPDQDLKKLWHDMRVKYQIADKDEPIDNSWATIPHYLSHPAYYQNYFRASVIKAQIYNYLKTKLGNISENKKTAEFLKENLFKYGISMEENELIKQMTGKDLSAKDFIDNIVL